MHTQVKSPLTIQKQPKITKTCLSRRAGRRVGAGKVTGEFLPADITQDAFPVGAKGRFSGATSSLVKKGPPIPLPGNELTRLCWLGSCQQ